MVEWIVRRAQGDRARVGTLTGVVCILANVALCAAKGAIGVLSGSVSIVADAMNNLSDASSNIVGVLGFKLASKPADPEHPYGHGRYEYLSGLVVAALVLLIGVELVKSSVERIVNPEPVVAFQRAGLGCHLGVSARKLPARAVIVDHQVVNAQDAGVAHNLVSNVLDQLRIGSLAQKRAHRILDKFKTAPANIGANGKADPCVKIDVRHLRNNCTRQHGARG